MAAKHKPKKSAKKKTASVGRFPAPKPVAHSKPSSSLFENVWTRRKFDIPGKKRKGEGRRVGLSRSLAIEKRKKTILQEFKQRGTSNVFLDHRFGEKDEALAEEDKAILRFQRERQAQWQRKSKFTLPDDDDDGETVLTHGGTALSMLDDFNDDISVEDDDDRQELDDEMVRELHFGGDSALGNDRTHGDDNEQKPKSKKEIMEEIIAKSKLYKMQKAKEKEEDAELKDQLDKDFAALAQSQALISLVRPKKVNAVNSALHEKEKPDDFDKLVKEMGMEMRAHASDRLKTDEELVKEEKARLEELEEKRKRRMLGDMDSEDSELEEADDMGSSRRKRKQSGISGDDLGENFLMDDVQPEKGWVDEVLARTSDREEETSDEGDDDISSDEDGISKDSPQDEGDDSSPDHELSEDEGSDEVWEAIDEDSQKVLPDTPLMKESLKKLKGDEVRKADLLNVRPLVVAQGLKISGSSLHLPFVIDAPKSLEEFKKLVDNRSVDDLLVVIQRIRTCNAIRLAAENRRKMQVFYGILLQYFAAAAGEKVPAMDRVDALVKPLIELTAETPYFAAVCARQRIVHMHEQLSDKLKNSDANGPWPSLRTLLLLRLWSMIFPTSDFRHVVMTPCVLLMAEFLVRCPVNSGQDLCVGIFLCALLLSVMRQARRFCPEALCFLYAVLMSAVPQRKALQKQWVTHGCAAFTMDLVASQPWLVIQSDCSTFTHVEELDFNFVMRADMDSPFFGTDRYRIAVLNCILKTLKGFSHIYEDTSCYAEVFKPFVLVLQNLLAEKKFPQVIKALLNELVQKLKENIAKHERLRQPLRMRLKKPVPIKQFNPKFEENFVQGRNYDPDRERAERKKLQRLLKEEAKGAARELRKDNYFLLEEKAKEKALMEEQRDEKYRKAMAFLQDQEAAFKSGQLGKGRKRRR